MRAIRVSELSVRIVALSTLVAMTPAVMHAQKAHPAGPPITTHGTTQASDAAAKGQANAEAKRTDADADKAANTADKSEDASERAALKSVRSQPAALLKGIKLTKPEEQSMDAIEKKYDAQLKTLDQQEDAAEKAGKPDTTIASKITALRTQERTDLRAVLTSSQASQFDKNAAALDSKK